MDRDSLEDLYTPVAALSGDPTAYAVEVALLPLGDRPDGDTTWHAATWHTTAAGAYEAVLPAAALAEIDPGPGPYRTWVRITAGDETPQLPSARYEIT